MEDKHLQSNAPTRLFPVHIIVWPYADIVFCSLVVQITRADDLVYCEISNESPTHRAEQFADYAELLTERVDLDHLWDPNYLLREYILQLKYRAKTYWGVWDGVSHSHKHLVGLGNHFRLHLAVIRSGQVLAQADIIYHSRALHLVESCYQEFSITPELRSLDPGVAAALDVITGKHAPSNEQKRGKDRSSR